MPKNYVVPNVSDDLQNRLQSITQQILSRTRLLLIIDKLHLYGDGHRQLTQDEKVELMRKDIDIELVRDSHGEQITAFRINYSAHDPHVAQRVTSELTDLFINENLKVRQQQSEDTTKFIGSSVGECASEPCRAGSEDSRVQRTARRRIAFPGSEQPPNPQRSPGAATERTGYSQHCKATARLPSDIDRAIPVSPYALPYR